MYARDDATINICFVLVRSKAAATAASLLASSPGTMNGAHVSRVGAALGATTKRHYRPFIVLEKLRLYTRYSFYDRVCGRRRDVECLLWVGADGSATAEHRRHHVAQV